MSRLDRVVTPTAATAATQRELHSCGAELEYTMDALGRLRPRCPRCQGVAAARPRHPDEVLVPQTLKTAPVTYVEVVREVPTLPPIAPGQLRCQGCSVGVNGRERFCVECRRQQARASKQRANEKRYPHRAPRPLQDVERRPVLRDPAGRACCERCHEPLPVKTGRPPRTCERCTTPAEAARREYKRTHRTRGAATPSGGGTPT